MSESERSVNDSLEQVSEAPVDSFWEIGQYKVKNWKYLPKIFTEYLPRAYITSANAACPCKYIT